MAPLKNVYDAYTVEGMRRHIDHEHASFHISTPEYERIMKIFDVAANGTRGKLAAQFVYALFCLDMRKHYINGGIKNLDCRGEQLLTALCTKIDPRMVFGSKKNKIEDWDLMLMAIVSGATLYALAMGKTVEVENLMSYEVRIKPHYRTVGEYALELLRDCRKFSKNQFDKHVFYFMDIGNKPVTSAKRRAF